MTTITHIVRQNDSRCKWFQAIIKEEYLIPEFLEKKFRWII